MRVLSVMMVALVGIVVLSAVPTTGTPGWWDSLRNAKNFGTGAVRGTRDMFKAYRDLRKANWRNSDKYFHARGNKDAARHGPGGVWAARTLSNLREKTDQWRGGSAADSAKDQAANKWGRSGGDLGKYRPVGLPSWY